jgi:2-polyprenyl-3-methyl-5-hydroxy-6-metoxy-1,4-benzoquinol methylase
MNTVNENTHCLACGSGNIHMALDLGQQPLANSYKDSADEPESRYPLAVRLCHDCFHLQLSHTVDPEIIYKNYLYATGTNQTIQDYCKWFADFCLDSCTSSKTVLDIGCNDGTQLDYFKARGVDTFGIDPAENLHDRSNNNHSVVCDFFGPAAVDQLNKVKYDIIVAQNVCAHNPDPYTFVQTCAELMTDDTVLFIQTSQADMVLHNEFDTIYHEHVNFFNANSMQKLAQRAGLNLVDVVKTPIHGNSYIFVLSRRQGNQPRVENIIALEAAYGLMNLDTYSRWANTVRANVDALVETLEQYRKQEYLLVGYGAAAKGNTLLNFANIQLDVIIDDNPLKQGKFTPGTGIPIVSNSYLEQQGKDVKIVFVPLAWNFFREIRSRILNIRNNNNDQFIKYFPKVEII